MTRLLLSVAAAALTLAAAKPLHAQAAASAPAAAAPTTGGVWGVKDVALTAAERQQFVGTYDMTMGGSGQGAGYFRVYEKDGTLFGDINGHHTATLLYQGDNVFRPKEDATYTVTFTIEQGVAKSLVVKGEHEQLEGVRAKEGK